MIACLILSHGQIGETVSEACKRITGKGEDIFTIPCEGQTPKVLYDEIVNLISSKKLTDGLFIFVSLKGGSCWNTAARIVKDFDRVELISGLSLPILISFVSKRNQYRFEDLGEILTTDAVRGINRMRD